MIAGALIAFLRAFVIPRNLGIVTGESGMMKLFAGLVRIPDVAFASWERLPGGKVPSEPVPLLAPDLAIEILSPSNTPQEMARKRREYFSAGVRLVWIIDLDARIASIYTAPEPPVIVSESQSIDGGSVLPGFVLPLRELFTELDRQA
jgi:Uma2 family endonuclease